MDAEPPPQGIYGYATQPLSPGEIWVQSTELGYLNGQVGLGAGLDLSAGLGLLDPSRPRELVPTAELGWAHRIGATAVRVAGGGLLPVAIEADDPDSPAPGIFGEAAVGWGDRGHQLNLAIHAHSSTEWDSAGAFLRADVGVQVASAQRVVVCSGGCTGSWFTFPLPTVALRYGRGMP